MSSVSKSRVDWVDAVKGLTIILVVMQHTTYGNANVFAQSPDMFLRLVEWAQPFRMPLFFLVAGLFAQKALAAPMRSFLDGKILHFAYFYLLWSLIQIGLKMMVPHDGGTSVTANDLVMALVEPFGILWFIYVLALFFATMRLARHVRPAIMLAFAFTLFMARPQTGWMLPDEFAHRFIFFVSGVYGAPRIFEMADWALSHARRATLLSAAMLAIVALVVFSGLVQHSMLELMAGYAGALATIMLVALLTSIKRSQALAYVGARSLAIYLAFFIPMAGSRIVLGKLGMTNADLATLIAIMLGVALPLIAYRVTSGTALAFLFNRPDSCKLAMPQKAAAARGNSRMAHGLN